MFVGLVNRERRIRDRRQALEDKAAAEKSWLERFKMQNESAMNTWQIQNEVLNRQRIEAEERAAERTAVATADERAFQMDLLTLKRAYEVDDRDAAQQWWKDQQAILNDYATQRAVDDQNRLQAWDNEKFERDRAAQQEDLKSELALRTEAANSQFDYQFNIRTEAAKEAAIAAHANAMQELLVERVMDGKAIGADFAAAVGGTTDPTAQIAQYSAAITALGVSKDNPVLAKLAGLNNPAVMKSTFDTLQKYHTQIVESGQTGPAALETFMEGANEYLGNLQITPADLGKPDAIIKQMETILGKPLDSLTKSIIKSMPQSGSVIAVKEPTLVENLDVSKLGPWLDVITQDAVADARSQITSINKAKTSALEMSKTGTADQQTMSKILLDWLGRQELKVNEALNDIKGENKDYYQIVSLFGNRSVAKAMEAEPKLRNAPIPDYMKQAKDAAPIEVLHTNADGTPAPTASVLRKLIEMNIVKKGDVVTFTNNQGKTVTMTYKGE